MDERQIVPISGITFYVSLTANRKGYCHYLVGTYGSPESPVSVSLTGTDSFPLRVQAAQKGLALILEGQTYN